MFIALFNFLKGNLLNGVQGNIVYGEMLKYSMPLMGGSEEGEIEDHYNLKKYMMKILGVNIYEPLTILEKELPLIALNNTGGEGSLISLTPFNISESSISQGEEEKTQGDKDKESLENNKDLKKTLNKGEPEVLIYNTHNNEDFSPGGPVNGITTVGNELKKTLEETYGISVIHDTTVHIKDYNAAYKSSVKTLEGYLDKHKDLKLIIDLHRDGGPSKASITTNINGENVAKIMFVISKARKNLDENMKLVNEMVETSNKLYPGFTKGVREVNRGKNNYNQDKSSKVVLIEIGSEVSTIDEAKASTKYLGRIIAETINKK